MAEKADQLSISEDEIFMGLALEEARASGARGEVPVGAVVVWQRQAIARAGNSPISRNDPTAHAEMLALRQASAHLANYRLGGCTLYVTLEPCPMCAGALVNARIDRLVFGARDLRFGAVRTKFRIADSDLLNHAVEIVEGVRAAEALELLQSFFQPLRAR